MPPLSVQIEDVSAVVKGDGPITNASRYACTIRLDKAGDNRFSLPATDPRTLLLADPDIHRYIRAHTRRGPTPRLEIGYGVVDNLSVNSESRLLEVSGPDVLDELMRTSVDTLFLHGAGDDDPMAAASILPAIMAYALPGWTTTGTPSKDLDPYQFGDESVFAALGKVARGDHFRLSDTVARQIEWLPTTTDGFAPVRSGIRAIDYGDTEALQVNADVCLITGGLQEVKDSEGRATRVKPRGSGNAGATQYLNGTTRVAPTGFTLHIDTNPEKSYLAYDAAEPTSADVIQHTERFSDIAPIKETAAAKIAAANQLFDAALVWLRRHIRAQRAYNLRVTKLHRRLRVGDSIHVQCKHRTDGYGWIWVDRHLLVLEISTTYDASGGDPVVDLQVTEPENDRYPQADSTMLAGEVIRLRDTASHVQVAARAMSATTATAATSTSGGFTFPEGTAPATPASATAVVYAKADGRLYSKDDAGTESEVSRRLIAVRAYRSAALSPATATWTTLNLGAETYDTDAMHDLSANTSRLTCQVAGTYAIVALASFANNATGNRGVRVRLNGATVLAQVIHPASGGSDTSDLCVATHRVLSVSDYLDMQVYQTSGGALALTIAVDSANALMMVRV